MKTFTAATVLTFLALTSVSAQALQTKEYPEIVPVFSKVSFDGRSSNHGKCTGTYISPRLILTAAHCVRQFFASKMNGHVTRFEDMQGRPVPDVTARLDDVYVYGKKKWYGYKKVHPIRIHVSEHAMPVLGSTLELQYVEQDLAILEFDQDFPHQRAVAQFTPEISAAVMIVGYGGHGTASSQVIKHVGYNRLTFAELDMFGVRGSTEVCSRPEKHTNDWASCKGDSGGPLIDRQSGAIIGVTSSTGIYQAGSLAPRKASYFTDITSGPGAEFVHRFLSQ